MAKEDNKGSKSDNSFMENYYTLYDIKYIKIKYFFLKLAQRKKLYGRMK